MERKLTAILCADVYGYSRLMGEDEEATLRTLSGHREIIDGLIERHHGRFVNSAGDSVLAEFASVVEAVNCAVEIQTALTAENANSTSERRMEFRIGVNLGDVMVEGEQIYGDGVNVAARLENLADPGGICISGTVHEQVRDRLALSYENRGEQTVKNIARPVHIWRIVLDGTPAVSHSGRRYLRGGVLSLTGLAIAIGTFVLVQHLSLKPPHTSASIPPLAKPALPLPEIPSIAVLPFTNLSGDPQQEYFSDGISNQLVEDLSRLPGLFVIARNSSFAYKGKSTSEHEIGRELGVKYVLEGSVRRVPERVRIGVELVDASSGTERWTQHFDRPLKDLFAMQDEIVGKVVTTLGLLFKADQLNLPHGSSFRPTDNLEAYDDFLRGLDYAVRFTKDDNAKARHYYEDAIQLDHGFAEAYATKAYTHFQSVWNQWSESPGEDLQHASELAHAALALDDSNSDALAILSYLDFFQRRYDQQVAEAERAVALNPNFAAGYVALSDALAATRPAEALSAAQKAIRLNPAARDFYAYLIGDAYNFMGRYQDAAAFLGRTVAVYPNLLIAHLGLTFAYVQLGRDRDARAEAAEIMRISPHYSVDSFPGVKDEELTRRVRKAWHKAGLK